MEFEKSLNDTKIIFKKYEKTLGTYDEKEFQLFDYDLNNAKQDFFKILTMIEENK